MREITISCRGITGPRQLHRILADALDFPQWYGRNLDALYDCLTEIGQPTHVIFADWQSMGDWAAGFQETFLDAAAENPTLSVVF